MKDSRNERALELSLNVPLAGVQRIDIDHGFIAALAG
jgi:hypothetical protein